MNTEQSPSIKHKSGIIIPPLSSSIHDLSPLLSYSFSPLIYQAHILQTAPTVYFKFLSVNPNCSLCLSRVSPNQNYDKYDSAATVSKLPEVFLSWSLLLSAGGLPYADSAF